jgi:hypothetical protein
MKSLRTALFWIAALTLPGGILLLAPKAIRVVQRMRERGA